MQRSRLESIGVSLPRKGYVGPGSLRHAVRAGKACFRSSRYRPGDVDVLVNTGVHRDGHYAEPAVATFVQKGLDINTEFRGRQTLSFDLLNSGCGLLSAADVVSKLLLSGTATTGMVVASEANWDSAPDPGYDYATSGAALLLDLSPGSDKGFGAFAFRSFPEHLEAYTSHVDLSQPGGRLRIRRDPALEQIYLDHVEQVLGELLEREQLRRGAIDLLVPSQISPRFIAGLPAATGVPAERIVDVTAAYGDTLTTSLALALNEAHRQGRVENGTRALLLACGAGVTIGAAAYYF